MNKYSSGITFLYYKNYEIGCKFIEEVLCLEEVMDQGFAKVYKISDGAFLGAVKANAGSVNSLYTGGTLVSFTTNSVVAEYQRIKILQVKDLTEIKLFEEIPLRSFFFKDNENHDFEVQEFIDKNDKLKF